MSGSIATFAHNPIYLCFAEPANGGARPPPGARALRDEEVSTVRVSFRRKVRVERTSSLPLGDARGNLFSPPAITHYRDRRRTLPITRKIIRIVRTARCSRQSFSAGRCKPRLSMGPQGRVPRSIQAGRCVSRTGARGGDEINIPQACKNSVGRDYPRHRLQRSNIVIGP